MLLVVVRRCSRGRIDRLDHLANPMISFFHFPAISIHPEIPESISLYILLYTST